MTYPLHLDLRGKRVLVVGAGPVGLRRARSAAAAGGVVTVVSLEAPDELELRLERRAFRAADVDGCWLVLACTGVVDDEVAAASEARGVWCVRSDDAHSSAAWVPAVGRVDDLVVSVTAGRDPRRAMGVRDALTLALETGEVPLRRTRAGVGSVSLVGGGPGDPGLLTVRGRRLLAGADVVVRDSEAPVVSLAQDVEVLEAAGFEETVELMVSRASNGQQVVRLTGADVARGLREVTACSFAGVTVEIVPGVSSL